jgi:hypothetical protein
MEIRFVDPSKKNEWNEYVLNHPDSIAWHCYEWCDVVKKNYTVNFYPLAAYENGKICGILPIYKVNGMLISVAYAVAGGMLWSNKEAQDLLLNKAIEISKKENLRKIVFKQYGRKIDADLSCDENFINKELDLTVSIDKLWEDLDERNKSELSGINESEYILDFSSSNINKFYKILYSHSHRNGLPCDSKKWISDLIDFKMYEIVLLKKGDKILAGTLIKKYRTSVSFPFSCSLGKDKKNVRNVFILYWLLIKRLRSEGTTIFHSGRIPKTNEAEPYRLGWGGKSYEYYYQYYPNESSSTEFSSKRGLKRKIFTTIWRLTPKFITKILNDKIVAKFP